MSQDPLFSQKYTIELQQEGTTWRGTLTNAKETIHFCGLDALWALLHTETPAQQLRQEILTDPLTGVLNRRGMDERMRPLCCSGGMALMFLDIDDFKQINDTYGHLAGDQVLCGVAKAIRSCLRANDEVGRIGGDEFVVLLPHMRDQESLLRKAEQVRVMVKDAAQVSVSIGVAWTGQIESYHDLLEMGDRALYQAKEAGKDRVMLYEALAEA